MVAYEFQLSWIHFTTDTHVDIYPPELSNPEMPPTSRAIYVGN